MRAVFRFLGGLLTALFAALIAFSPPADRLGWAAALAPLAVLFAAYAAGGPRATERLVAAASGGLNPPPQPDR